MQLTVAQQLLNTTRIMDFITTIVSYAILLYIVYKLLDRLIRIPRVGNYRDRYVLITGCDTGFGSASAQRLDKLGCKVFAGCLTETGETELRKVCSERLHTVSLDVTKPESVRTAFEYVRSKLPRGKGLWGVLNNAGTVTAYGAPDWLSLDDYKKGCDVNLWGLIDVTLTFLPLVKKAKGRIVNTSSIAGRITYPRLIPYCISKYGVQTFSDGLRRALFDFGIQVSIIEPGAFGTSIVGTLVKEASRSWENAPPEIRAEYGEEHAKSVLKNEAEAYITSASPDIGKVIDAYEHALLGCYPRARYTVGFDANYIMLPIQCLPEWLGDWILRRMSSGISPPDATKCCRH